MLEEIKQGLYSDVPGVALYRKVLNSASEPSVDADGLQLWECVRGTNIVETIHSKIVRALGTWHCGTELCDPILAEFCHQHNYDTGVARHTTDRPL